MHFSVHLRLLSTCASVLRAYIHGPSIVPDAYKIFTILADLLRLFKTGLRLMKIILYLFKTEVDALRCFSEFFQYFLRLFDIYLGLFMALSDSLTTFPNSSRLYHLSKGFDHDYLRNPMTL